MRHARELRIAGGDTPLGGNLQRSDPNRAALRLMDYAIGLH